MGRQENVRDTSTGRALRDENANDRAVVLGGIAAPSLRPKYAMKYS